ncbi:MAG: 4Fe-4S binding protein [Coriobacteriia bacterium]|jgi:2-oxoglutarate ferredoxin oxidoreductase subunit delta|nr:4Fe-4S binding protein [Coriobacteriia bacterium]MDR2714066.1 4Fe-4S binding protein [Coriobacteriales bacterium]
MPKVVISTTFCKGCGICVDVCPEGILKLNDDIITQKGYHPAICTNDDACTGCTSCALMCPDVAITIER